MQVMVELVANASCRKDILSHTYSECVSNLFQIAVDVSIYGERETFLHNYVSCLIPIFRTNGTELTSYHLSAPRDSQLAQHLLQHGRHPRNLP